MSETKLDTKLQGLKAIKGTQKEEIATLKEQGASLVALDNSKIKGGPKLRTELIEDGVLKNLQDNPTLKKAFIFNRSTCTNGAKHCAVPAMQESLELMAKAFTKSFPKSKLIITSSYRTGEEQKHAGKNKAKGAFFAP